MTLREDIVTARDPQQDKRTIAEKYHDKRVKAIREDGGPYSAEGDSGLAVHIIDLGAFESGSEYRLREIEDPQKSIPVLSNPYGSSRGRGDRVKNTDCGLGVVTTGMDSDVVRRYTHVANVGIVEATTNNIVSSEERGRVEGPHIDASTFEGILVERTARMMDALNDADVGGPYFVTFTLWGVSGVHFVYLDNGFPRMRESKFEADTVSPFGTEVQSAVDPLELREAMNEPLTSLWRAAGYGSPLTYTDGDWEVAEDLGL